MFNFAPSIHNYENYFIAYSKSEMNKGFGGNYIKKVDFNLHVSNWLYDRMMDTENPITISDSDQYWTGRFSFNHHIITQFRN